MCVRETERKKNHMTCTLLIFIQLSSVPVECAIHCCVAYNILNLFIRLVVCVYSTSAKISNSVLQWNECLSTEQTPPILSAYSFQL